MALLCQLPIFIVLLRRKFSLLLRRAFCGADWKAIDVTRPVAPNRSALRHRQWAQLKHAPLLRRSSRSAAQSAPDTPAAKVLLRTFARSLETRRAGIRDPGALPACGSRWD